MMLSHLRPFQRLLCCPWLQTSCRAASVSARQQRTVHSVPVCTIRPRLPRDARHGRTHALRKRPHTAPSTLLDSEDPLDEALYNPRQVDDWGVNRDMQQEYRPPLEKEFEACKASAANLVAFRPHSRAELAAKLTDKGFDRETIEQALDRLHELGLQSDREFAAVFARSKWRQSRWAPSRIRIELVRRGVSREDMEAGLHETFGEDLHRGQVSRGHHHANQGAAGGGEGGEEGVQSLDEQLLATAQRQATLTKGLPAQTRRRRLVAWLQRRGHGWSTISALLDRVGP